jgi:hypothetical protein
MAELKTKETKTYVEKFLNSVSEAKKREDSFKILDMMKKITKEEPKMWGPALSVLVTIIINMIVVMKEICVLQVFLQGSKILQFILCRGLKDMMSL